MTGNTAFAVPKDRQGVTVRLGNGTAIEGVIFLEAVSDFLSSHQKVTMFLENDNTFFPIKLDTTGKTEFINKKTSGPSRWASLKTPKPATFRSSPCMPSPLRPASATAQP